MLAAVHRGDPARPGHPEGARRARLRRGRGRARRPAADHRPAQPRRLRRLRPRDVRGAGDAPRLRADPVHGRRHPAGARLGAARRRVLRGSPASRCWSAGRCCRCRPGRSSRRWARSSTGTRSSGATPRGTEPHHDLAERTLRTDAVAAPAHRRRLQRLVDVPDPAGRRRGPRAAAAAVHQVGRRRVRAARPGPGLPDGDGAGHRDLAHVVPGEGRHERLAGLLPLPQPAGRRRAARARTTRGRCCIDILKRTAAAPDADGVLGRGAAGDGAARLPRRPGGAVPEAAGGAGRGPGDKRAEYDDGRPLDSATQVPLSRAWTRSPPRRSRSRPPARWRS